MKNNDSNAWAQQAKLDDPSFYVNDNRDLYQRMQRDAPVFWYAPGKFWAITKYNDVRMLLSDRTATTNSKGILISARGDEWAEAFKKAGRKTLVFTDPPEHTGLRSALTQLISPAKINALETSMLTTVNEILDRAPKQTPFDFAEDYAGSLPALVVAKLLDVPQEIFPKFIEWARATRDSTEKVGAADYGDVLKSLNEMHEFFKGNIADRRAKSGNDFVSGLLAIEIDGMKLSDEWVLGLCGTLVSGGYEASKSFIMSAALLLHDNPTQKQLLIDDPTHWPNAVQELLRFLSPSNGVARYMTRDIELHGKQIKAGDWIVCMLGAANVDEEIWENPLTLDLTRSARPIATFGFGAHTCIGNVLARIEARIALQTLVERYPKFLVTGQTARRPSTLSNSFEQMVVILEPEQR